MTDLRNIQPTFELNIPHKDMWSTNRSRTNCTEDPCDVYSKIVGYEVHGHVTRRPMHALDCGQRPLDCGQPDANLAAWPLTCAASALELFTSLLRIVKEPAIIAIKETVDLRFGGICYRYLYSIRLLPILIPTLSTTFTLRKMEETQNSTNLLISHKLSNFPTQIVLRQMAFVPHACTQCSPSAPMLTATICYMTIRTLPHIRRTQPIPKNRRPTNMHVTYENLEQKHKPNTIRLQKRTNIERLPFALFRGGIMA